MPRFRLNTPVGRKVEEEDASAARLPLQGRGRSAPNSRRAAHQIEECQEWSSKTVKKYGLHVMKRIRTFVAHAVFAFLVGSSGAIAEQSSGAGPIRLNAPRGQAPAPVIKPIGESRIPKQIRSAPAPRHVNTDQGASQASTQRPTLTGAEHTPSNAVSPQSRPRAVYREVARRINIAGGVLVLPVVVYYEVPVILNVPGLGYVDVPEDEYARLYEKLSSSDPEQLQEAMSLLQTMKAQEEAEVEAIRRGPERTEPTDTRDLSEPIFFDLPSRFDTRRRRLY